MSDLLYRQCLEEKLNSILVDLNAGRGIFSHSSGPFKKLKDSIDDVLAVLDKHSGEDWLEKNDRDELETKIHQMKMAAQPYLQYKLKQGALADGAPLNLRKRYRGAYYILKIPSKIPVNPGEEHGIITPSVLEKGDKKYNDWAHKYKQNISYLAKKQIYTYEKNITRHDREIPNNGELTKEEFEALMDFMEPDKILTYKDDGDLCQKYPDLRFKLELAIRAKEKLINMNEEQIDLFMLNWATDAAGKSLAAAKKSRERKGQDFTEKEKRNVEEKIEFFINERVKAFRKKDTLIEKGDVLEQVARFVDLKLKVMTNKNYIQLFHTNSISKIYRVKDYERLIHKSEDENDKEFYKNLRDIRELEECGIQHVKENYEKTYYKEVDETLHKTIKREIGSIKIGKFSLKGAGAVNNAYGAKDSSSTLNSIRFGKSMKARAGKLGLKLHTKHKTLSASGGLVFGQAKAGSSVGASYLEPGTDLLADGEFSTAKVRGKLKLDTKVVGAALKGSMSAGYSSAYAKGAIGSFVQKDENGNNQKVYGAYGKAGYTFSAYKGEIGGSLNILGVSFSVSLSGYGAGIGGDIGGGISSGGINFSFSGALGIGAGLAVNINWSGLYNNIKNKWRKSKLQKLIATYKKNKKNMKTEASNPETPTLNNIKEPKFNVNAETTKNNTKLQRRI